MAGRLGEVVFHAKLGSLADKSARMVALTQWLAGVVGARNRRSRPPPRAPLPTRVEPPPTKALPCASPTSSPPP